MSEMKALRWHGARDIRYETVPRPRISQSDEVLVDVEVAGVCGTDLHEYSSGPNMIRTGPHPLTGAQPPLTAGHEFSGVVAAVGEGVPDLEVGQRVTADPCLRCERCRACLRGDYHLCDRGGSVGLASDGAFAESVVVPRVNVIPLPDDVSFESAAVAEPLAVGLHAATRAGVGLGDTVLITGAGPIGIAAMLGSQLRGAAGIYVSEPDPQRAEVARQFGAHAVLDPTLTDVRREVFRANRRNGPDRVIDATGRPEAIELGLRSLRRGGSMAVAGISASDLSVDLRQLVLYERSIAGTLGYNRDIERVIAMIETNKLDTSLFTGARKPMSEGPQIFDDISNGRSDSFKVLLDPKE